MLSQQFSQAAGSFFWKQNQGDKPGCMDSRNLHLSSKIAKYHTLIFLFYPGTRKMENPLERISKKGKIAANASLLVGPLIFMDIRSSISTQVVLGSPRAVLECSVNEIDRHSSVLSESSRLGLRRLEIIHFYIFCSYKRKLD